MSEVTGTGCAQQYAQVARALPASRTTCAPSASTGCCYSASALNTGSCTTTRTDQPLPANYYARGRGASCGALFWPPSRPRIARLPAYPSPRGRNMEVGAEVPTEIFRTPGDAEEQRLILEDDELKITFWTSSTYPATLTSGGVPK